MISKFDLIDTYYRLLHSRFAEYTFIPVKHGTFRVGHILGISKNFKGLKLFSDHSAIKLEVNNNKIPKSFPMYLEIKKYRSQAQGSK